MEVKLDGKLALVTGASRGIGRAIALRLGESGADVVVNYRTRRTEAEEVSEKIREMGRQSIAIQADVSNADQVDMMVREVVTTFTGGLDILVNNAGITAPKEVIHMRDEDWDRTLNTNLKGAFYVSRAVATKMIEKGKGGRIIGIASGAGHSGRPGLAHYCASKAGLILFCKALAIELAPHGINVNSVSVGFVDVLRRPGKPEDIANVVAFLASEGASWITGTDFRVDGGESAGRVPYSTQ